MFIWKNLIRWEIYSIVVTWELEDCVIDQNAFRQLTYYTLLGPFHTAAPLFFSDGLMPNASLWAPFVCTRSPSSASRSEKIEQNSVSIHWTRFCQIRGNLLHPIHQRLVWGPLIALSPSQEWSGQERIHAQFLSWSACVKGTLKHYGASSTDY